MNKPRPSIERIREVLAYDARTGRLTWCVSPVSHVKPGDDAGCNDGKGYREVKVDGCRIKTHRVIFAIVNGRWPENEVDHKDGDSANNRDGNLRDATATQNRINQKRRKDNTTGFKGVERNGKGFLARIKFSGRRINLGTYPTPEEAHAVYLAKAVELYGEFARAA